MKENQLPNKCLYCGLRVFHEFSSPDETRNSDQIFFDLRRLHEARIIKSKYSRVVGMSNTPGDCGTTELCAVASSAWREHHKSCKHWVLRIEGASVADYLSIYNDRRNYRVAIWVAIWGAFLAILLTALPLAVEWLRTKLGT